MPKAIAAGACGDDAGSRVEVEMQEFIRRALSFLRDKQILHRLGVLVSLTVIAIACYILYRQLRNIDLAKVLDAYLQHAPTRGTGLYKKCSS